jgi:hypothetical protein
MSDLFASQNPGLEAPARQAFAIGTAAYGSALANTTRALYVGTGGTVVANMAGGNTVTFANVQDGSILPVRVVSLGTATSATGIVGLL